MSLEVTMEKGKNRSSKIELILFIAGEETNSIEALNNLERIIEENDLKHLKVKIIDVYKEPEYAQKFNVFLTPALVIKSSKSTNIIYGSLSDRNKINSLLTD